MQQTNAFQRAWDRVARLERRYVRDVDTRAWRRFCAHWDARERTASDHFEHGTVLSERNRQEDRLYSQLQRRRERIRDALYEANQALDVEWDRVSRALAPFGWDEARAANYAIGADGWNAICVSNLQLSLSRSGLDVSIAEAEWLFATVARINDMSIDDARTMINMHRRRA